MPHFEIFGNKPSSSSVRLTSIPPSIPTSPVGSPPRSPRSGSTARPNEYTRLLPNNSGAHLARNVGSISNAARKIKDRIVGINYYSRLIRFLTHDFLFTDEIRKRLERNSTRASRIRHYQEFTDGYGEVINKLWPIIFWLMMVNDSIQFSDKNNRYGVDVKQFILGYADNDTTKTSYLGSDILGDPQFWVWPFIIIVAAVASGFVRMGLSWREIEERIQLGEANYANTDTALLYRNSNNDHFSLPSERWYKSRNPIFNAYRGYAKWSQGGSPSAIEGKNIGPVAIGLPNQLEEAKEVKLTAGNSLLLIPALMIAYAKLHFYVALANKIHAITNYIVEKSNCASQKNVYLFSEDHQQYECSVVGDWDFVPRPDVGTMQGGLNALFSSNKTVDEIIAYIDPNSSQVLRKNLIEHNDFTVIDLSQLDLTKWTIEQFRSLFDLIKGAVTHLESLNLSQSVLVNIENKNQFISVLNDFLHNVTVDTLNISNLNLGTENCIQFLSGVVAGQVKHFIASYNNLTDAWFAAASNALVFLESLVVQGNPFGDAGLQAVGKLAAHGFLRLLDVSYTNQGGADFSQFGQTLSNATSLETVRLVKVNKDDSQLSDFGATSAGWKFKTIDISDDGNTGDTIVEFYGNCVNTTVTSVVSNGARLQLNHFQTLATLTDGSQIEAMSFENCKMTIQNVEAVLTIRGLRAVNFGNNYLTNQVLPIIYSALQRNDTMLEAMGLSAIGLTDENPDIFVAIFALDKLKRIDVSRNKLGSKACRALNENLLSLNNLVHADLTFNTMDNAAFINLADLMSRMVNLQTLLTHGNPGGVKGVVNLLIQVADATPRVSTIGDEVVSVSEARAQYVARVKNNLHELSAPLTDNSTDIHNACRRRRSNKHVLNQNVVIACHPSSMFGLAGSANNIGSGASENRIDNIHVAMGLATFCPSLLILFAAGYLYKHYLRREHHNQNLASPMLRRK